MITTYQKKSKINSLPLQVFHILHLCPKNENELDVDSLTTFLTENLDWYRPYACPICFPKQDDKAKTRGKALLEADQSNLNPIVVFGNPSVKKVHPIPNHAKKDVVSDELSFVGCSFRDAVFEDSLVYLQDDNNQGFRTYSHKTDVFINKNYDNIVTWLGKVKTDFKIQQNSRVVILSPCQNNETNMPFVNLVNEIVFGSAATIIYHEADREYPENFKLLNYDFLKREDIERQENQVSVYYVDDDLVSGRSFFTIYDLFRSSTNFSDKISMTGAIFLMNKASATLNTRVTRASKKVHSFVAVNLPQYYSVRQRSPFERERLRYGAIEKHTLSYEQEEYFGGKRARLQSPDDNDSEDKELKELHMQMFLATNALFEVFATKDFQSMSFKQLCDACESYDDRIVNRFAIMRVLARDTFTMYRPIKEKVFEWISDLLPSYEEDINRWMEYKDQKKDGFPAGFNTGKIEDGRLFPQTSKDRSRVLDRHLEEQDLNDLDSLIRRSALLGNYQIIQEDFFRFLEGVFNGTAKKTEPTQEAIEDFEPDEPIDLYKSEETELDSEESYKLSVGVDSGGTAELDTRCFEKRIRSHYCELIHKNPACVPQLFSNLEKVVFSSERGKLFKRRVKEEAVVVVDYLFDEMVAAGFHERVSKKTDNEPVTPDKVRQVVTEWREKEELKNAFVIADAVMKVNKGGRKSFESYCYLKNQFYRDSDRKSRRYENVKEALDDIFANCKKLFDDAHEIGAFFAVFDIAGDLRLVYDRNESGAAILRNKIRHEEFQSYLMKLDLRRNKSVVKSIYEGKGTKTDMDFLSKFGEEYKYLDLLHIGSSEEKKTYGIIGFYSKTNFIDSIGNGYLMLLRRDFLKFISMHHQNDEFVALVLAENKRRFEYLSGHGRETIQKLATTYKDVFERVVSTMERVQGIFLMNDSTNDINVEQFDKYFGPDTLTTALDESFRSRLQEMAKKAYSGDNIVEWDEDVDEIDVSLQNVNSFKGKFSIRLLEFICFELILNAKKNRFVKTPAFNDVYEGTRFTGNRFELTILPHDDFFEVRVSGTGHRVWPSTKKRIDDNAEIKDKNNISGLDLIIQLITTFDNGNRLIIDYQKDIGPVYWNTVSVRIKYR